MVWNYKWLMINLIDYCYLLYLYNNDILVVKLYFGKDWDK